MINTFRLFVRHVRVTRTGISLDAGKHVALWPTLALVFICMRVYDSEEASDVDLSVGPGHQAVGQV